MIVVEFWKILEVYFFIHVIFVFWALPLCSRYTTVFFVKSKGVILIEK